MGAEHTGSKHRGLKTQADQGFESRGMPFLPLRERVRDRIQASAVPRGPSCAPSALVETYPGRAPQRRPQVRRSPILPRNIDRREQSPRPQMTTHWWACPYAGSASSNCGCVPCRRCAPTTPPAFSRASVPRRPIWIIAANPEPRGCVRRNSHRVRVAAPT
jgi:hypothetical protein